MNSDSDNGFTPLQIATAENAVECVDILVRHGANLNAVCKATGNTPLHDAIIWGSIESAKLLLLAGADPALKDGKGQTPEQLARRHGKSEIARLLLDSQSKGI